MLRAVLTALVAAMILATGVASTAIEPPRARPAAAAASRAEQPHHIRIVVSGPPDTLMRVIRGRTGTDVALGGHTFDHAFVEPAGSKGYLGIKVLAASREPRGIPVRCRIVIDGKVVSSHAAARPDQTGLAQVLCTVPQGV
ncbi:hypothetical protein ACFS2C_16900 [Prauserella oleivorans]|uniref:Uncharacterized protein n=1 Tax=Prauserella oleivorans TaxID=1478153 RepID=A0ABW5WAT8_9PSEU